MAISGRARGVLYGAQFVLTAGAIYWIFDSITFSSIADGLARVPASILLLGLGVYAVMTVGRVFRFQMLGARHIGFADMLAVVWVHNLFNNLLPMRLGEVAYPVLVRRFGDVRAGTSTAAVLVSRVADLLGLCIVLALGLFIAGNPLPISSAWVFASLFAIIAGGVVAILAGKRVLSSLVRRQRTNNFVARKLREVEAVLSAINPTRLFGPLLFWSIFIVIVGNLVNFWVLRAFGLTLDFWQINLALGASFLMAVLPIQPIGGWGVFEGAVVMGLAMYGVDNTTGLAAGVALHVANYVFFLPLGVAGMAYLWWRRDLQK